MALFIEITSFLAGFAADSVVLSVVLLLLTPWLVRRAINNWVEEELLDTVLDLAHDPRMGELRALLIKQFAGGILGGRPGNLNLKGVAGMAVQALIQRFLAGGNLGIQTPGVNVNVGAAPVAVPPSAPPPTG